MNNQTLAIILSSGAAAFLWVVFKGIDLLRYGASSTEGKSLQRIERGAARSEARAVRAEREREEALTMVDYWRKRTGELEYLIVRNWGPEVLPAREPLPIFPPLPDKPKEVESA